MDAGDLTIVPYRPIEWVVHDLKRRVVICDAMSLHNRRSAQLVGFFGERHPDRDGTPLEEANFEIVLEFQKYPGILSYSSMELADGNWANLVLHNVAEDRETWRASEAHARAARELSPLYLPDGSNSQRCSSRWGHGQPFDGRRANQILGLWIGQGLACGSRADKLGFIRPRSLVVRGGS